MTRRLVDVRRLARLGEPFPVAVFMGAKIIRPIADVSLHEVDGGLWQAQCVCRWHGTPRESPEAVAREGIEHAAKCGICLTVGRSVMHECSCANCQRRRSARERWQEEERAAAAASE